MTEQYNFEDYCKEPTARLSMKTKINYKPTTLCFKPIVQFPGGNLHIYIILLFNSRRYTSQLLQVKVAHPVILFRWERYDTAKECQCRLSWHSQYSTIWPCYFKLTRCYIAPPFFLYSIGKTLKRLWNTSVLNLVDRHWQNDGFRSPRRKQREILIQNP